MNAEFLIFWVLKTLVKDLNKHALSVYLTELFVNFLGIFLGVKDFQKQRRMSETRTM